MTGRDSDPTPDTPSLGTDPRRGDPAGPVHSAAEVNPTPHEPAGQRPTEEWSPDLPDPADDIGYDNPEHEHTWYESVPDDTPEYDDEYDKHENEDEHDGEVDDDVPIVHPGAIYANDVLVSFAATGPAPAIAIRGLALRGPQRDYLVDFVDERTDRPRQLALIAGEISTGKTSILQFIEYCLGSTRHPEHDEIVANVRTAQLAIEVLEDAATRDNSDESAKANKSENQAESSHTLDSRVNDGSDGAADSAASTPQTERRISRYVLERPVGSGTSSEVLLFRGDHRGLAAGMPERLSTVPADTDSVSQFLLRICGLAGLRVKQAPTREDSDTSILSFRDLGPLWFLTHRRMDNGDLVLESNPARTLKLRQVVDYFFGVSDDEASALSHQIQTLRRERDEGAVAIAGLRSFLRDAGIADEHELDATRDRQRDELRAARNELEAISAQLRATTNFAEEARARYAQANQVTRRLAGEIRERETLLARLGPLRSQYADDLLKLDMIDESQRLFDSLNLRVCPACLTDLGPLSDAGGECSLCHSPLTHSHSERTPNTTSHESGKTAQTPVEQADSARGDDVQTEGHAPAGSGISHNIDPARTDVASERRSVKARLKDLKGFIEQVSTEARLRRAELEQAQREVAVAQQNLDELTSSALAPYMSQRDALTTRVANADAALRATQANRDLLDLLSQREYAQFRISSSLQAALARQRELERTRQSRDDLITRLSGRFARTLRDFGYPKLDGNARLERTLIPQVRGKRYDRVGSSGAQQLIAMAWELTIFEEATETGRGHPGFLLIDSPQKNLKPSTGRPAQTATIAPPADQDDATVEATIRTESVGIVDHVYEHIANWLADHRNAQVIIVDNEPPADRAINVAVRYSADSTNPPYGLIDNAID